MKRYLILPGKVYSKTDMDTHYVSANELMRLYSVAPEECVVLHNEGGRRRADEEDHRVPVHAVHREQRREPLRES